MTSSVVADVDPDEFVPLAGTGRRVTRVRRVRLSDVTGTGRLRLDALARYLHDIAGDDVDDAGLGGAWVLRRVALAFGDLPVFRDDVTLTTFCSGTGSRWAERRTTLEAGGAVRVEAVALWVFVDPAGRPVPLEGWFFDLYGDAAAGRRVSSRLQHRPPPNEGVNRRPWPLRVTDIDVLNHVNNAASWSAVEDELARRPASGRLSRAEIEYRAAVDLDDPVELLTRSSPTQMACWLLHDGEVRTSAVVTFVSPGPGPLRSSSGHTLDAGGQSP
ncbi:MAG TPA: acyl-ACP thioesterase domain-containing protein [Acidimicrobiia bacterium]|nr:acyl-ACP thioesterase domain-containing protein [Acidimicrobiia bacterium]